MAGHIHLAIDGPVARVTLDHGGKFNAMSRSMWKTLQTIFLELQTKAAVRCIVVQGAAGHFCAGGDISEYPSFRFDEAQLQQFHEQEVWGALQAMLDCDVPILAQIEGNCMGAGVEIAKACDFSGFYSASGRRRRPIHLTSSKSSAASPTGTLFPSTI